MTCECPARTNNDSRLSGIYIVMRVSTTRKHSFYLETNISDDILEISQSRSTAFPVHEKKMRHK